MHCSLDRASTQGLYYEIFESFESIGSTWEVFKSSFLRLIIITVRRHTNTIIYLHLCFIYRITHTFRHKTFKHLESVAGTWEVFTFFVFSNLLTESQLSHISTTVLATQPAINFHEGFKGLASCLGFGITRFLYFGSLYQFVLLCESLPECLLSHVCHSILATKPVTTFCEDFKVLFLSSWWLLSFIGSQFFFLLCGSLREGTLPHNYDPILPTRSTLCTVIFTTQSTISATHFQSLYVHLLIVLL